MARIRCCCNAVGWRLRQTGRSSWGTWDRGFLLSQTANWDVSSGEALMNEISLLGEDIDEALERLARGAYRLAVAELFFLCSSRTLIDLIG